MKKKIKNLKKLKLKDLELPCYIKIERPYNSVVEGWVTFKGSPSEADRYDGVQEEFWTTLFNGSENMVMIFVRDPDGNEHALMDEQIKEFLEIKTPETHPEYFI
jgi:hypothetical protein